jgi:hypothetical protein
MKTAVAFLIFNRPDTTEQVFEAIRQAKPSKLLVIADGPRIDKPGEAEKCAAARAVIERVDWDCEVLTNYADINMGCKQRVSSGLDWVFNTVEEAIILEDDCLPDPTFFGYCEELLDKYRHDTRVVMISGTNLLGEWKPDVQDYCFSHIGSIWGWASWRRVWNHYDVNIALWSEPEVKARIRDVIVGSQYLDISRIFDDVYAGKIDTWDFQWLFTRLSQSGLSIIPSKNLVSNLGFRNDGTHNKNEEDPRANMPVSSMSFPLRNPMGFGVDRDFDKTYFKKYWKRNSLFKQYLGKMKKLFLKSFLFSKFR